MRERTPVVPRSAAVFIVTALGSFMAALDVSVVNVAFPELQRSFASTSRASLSWVITGYSIVFGALLVTAGRTADRVGRRRVFFSGIAVFVLGSALCGLAPTVPLLVAGRVVQGAGAAFILPASLSLLLGAFPASRRSEMVALWGGVGALAVATGPSLGAAIISAGGWRGAFYINLPVGLVAWLWGRAVLTESAPTVTVNRPDYAGAILVSASLGTLVLALSQGPGWGWASGRVLGLLIATVALGVTFVLRSLRHPEPVIDFSLFAAPSFRIANAATFVYAMGFFAMLLGNILFLTGVWHYSTLRAGLAVTPGPIVVALVARPAGKLAARIGFRTVLMIGAACFGAGLALYAVRSSVDPAYLTRWLPATLVTGLGIGLTFPVLSAASVASLPPERFGVGSAVNQTARQVGGSVGIAVLVAVLGSPGSPAQALNNFRHLWLYGAAMALTSGALTSLLPRRQKATGASSIPAPAVPSSAPAIEVAVAPAAAS